MIKYILIILLLTSCSNLLSLFKEEDLAKQEANFLNMYNEVTCGQLTNNINLVHNSKYTIDEFGVIAKRLQSKYRFNFAELVISYLSYQQIVRPDASHQDSRLQFILHYNGKQQYFDLSHINNQSYQDFASLIKKSYKVRNIKTIERILNTVFPKKLHVQGSFHRYLASHKKNLINKSSYRKYYKLNEPLLTGERFLRKRIKLLNNSKIKIYPPPTFSMNLAKGKNQQLSCSFDPGLYQNEIYVLKKKVDLKNTFAMQMGSHYFMAYSATASTPKQGHYPAPFCQYEDNVKSIVLMGFGSRDPAQIIYNLINYEVFNADKAKDLVSYIDFPRHEILNNPNRILFESKRSSKEQLSYFLSLTLPVYHSDAIGEVWSMHTRNKSRQFISDTRNPAFQSCMKQ